MRESSATSAFSSMRSTPDADDFDTPASSASSVNGRDIKRRKLEDKTPNVPAVDKMAPVFLRMSFKTSNEPEEPDTKLEDDAKYQSRPWQERSTMVPLLLAFRVQFPDLFLGIPDIGPQDIEEGLESEVPSTEVQEFMCGLLTLAANRLKSVEYPQYNRPLNDCVANHFATRGDPFWEGANPLAQGRRFPDLSPDDRLRLMFCLLDWALTDSKVVRERIEEAYKNRTAVRVDTPNPCELHMIGKDDRKHSYYLLKGTNTRFRLYIQTDISTTPCRWYSICSTLEELRTFTSELSNNVKTVRGRRIVDDLASIHIPEIERAEQARTHQLQKRTRAEYERNRRAAYAYVATELSTERGSRTRGRRVDYNNMLQGQGADEDGNSSGWRNRRNLSSEAQSGPSSSRSGRMLKRPRGWEDSSPDSDLRKALVNSLADDASGAPEDEELFESEIIVLKYDMEKYKNWSRVTLLALNGREGKTVMVKQQSLDREASMTPKTSDLGDQHLTEPHSHETTADVTLSEFLPSRELLNKGTTNTIKSTGEISSNQEVTESNAPPSGDHADSASRETEHVPEQDRSSAQDLKQSQGQPKILDPANASLLQATLQTLRPTVRCLIIGTLKYERLDANHFNGILEQMIGFAAEAAIKNIDILLHTSPAVREYSNSTAAFVALQKSISSLYVKAAKVAQDRNISPDITIIFDDWCGYTLAQEDFQWSAIGSVSEDRPLLTNFADLHKSTYPTHDTPQMILTGETTSRPDSAVEYNPNLSKYENVALGGTFDHLHAGHKILLTMAAWLAQKRLLIGITDDALLVNKKHKEVMQNITERTKCVESLMHRIKRGIVYELVPIVDVAGPTATDASLQALVASRETEAGSNQIKELRSMNKLPAMDFFFIDVIGPEGEVTGEEMDRLKLSSTAIRERLASKL